MLARSSSIFIHHFHSGGLLGHHAEELQQAQALIRLLPPRRESLEVLQHAGGCNGLVKLSHQLETVLQEMGPLPEAPAPPDIEICVSLTARVGGSKNSRRWGCSFRRSSE